MDEILLQRSDEAPYFTTRRRFVLSSSTSALIETTTEEYWLKRTILVEERTAIWCPSCAEIDPELAIVAESHGARTAIVGIHVSDEFENEASLARIEYQKQIDDTEYGTPTFFVDGIKTAEGYDAWDDVQSRILTQENNRGAPEEMALKLIGEDRIAYSRKWTNHTHDIRT